MFYSKFADDYEKIFPYRDSVYAFLNGFIDAECRDILDIGCATGHYCGKFSEKKLNVTGIDLDSEMIKNARRNYREVIFEEMNLEDIKDLDKSFDFVYSTGNVMAHISESSFSLFLDELNKILGKKGIWVFQVINWDFIMMQNDFDFPLIETESKVFQRKYTEIKKSSLIFNTELKDKSDGKSLFKDHVTMYPVASDKYLKMHRDKGFELIGHYSDYSKTPFNKNSFSADIYVFSAAST